MFREFIFLHREAEDHRLKWRILCHIAWSVWWNIFAYNSTREQPVPYGASVTFNETFHENSWQLEKLSQLQSYPDRASITFDGMSHQYFQRLETCWGYRLNRRRVRAHWWSLHNHQTDL